MFFCTSDSEEEVGEGNKTNSNSSSISSLSISSLNSNYPLFDALPILLECASGQEDRIMASLGELSMSGDMAARKVVYSVLESFIRTHSSSAIRGMALECLIRNYGVIPFSIAELLGLIKCIFERLVEEEIAGIRVRLVSMLQRLLRVKKPVTWHELVIPVSEVNAFAGGFVSVLNSAKSTKKVSINQIVFAVLCFIGANDIDSGVRLAAIRLASRLEKLPTELLTQSCKKDALGGPVSATSLPFKMNLLACGVFAHGIEEQFAKIRIESLQSLHTLVLKDLTAFPAVLNVFIDALLDECDWIRLAALKLLTNLLECCNHFWPLDGHFQALLAALDDLNPQIRTAALLLLATIKTIHQEAFFHTQRCLEALIAKYVEAEGEVIAAALAFASRNEVEMHTCGSEWISHLLGSPEARLFVGRISGSVSSIHQCFLAVLLKRHQPQQSKRILLSLQARHESLATRVSCDFSALSLAPFIKDYALRREDALTRHGTDLHAQPQNYFTNEAGKVTTFCAIKHFKSDPEPSDLPRPLPEGYLRAVYVEIWGVEVVGARECIKVDLMANEQRFALDLMSKERNRIKIPIQEGGTDLHLKIVNGQNGLDMVQEIHYVFQ